MHQTIKISEDEYFKINRDLCLEVAKFAKKAGVKQFVFLSTVKVYGKFIKGYSFWNEKSQCFPDDAYGKSKYAAEIALKELNDSNFTVSIVRTPLVYGEGVKANMLSILKLIKKSHFLPFKNVNNREALHPQKTLLHLLTILLKKEQQEFLLRWTRMLSQPQNLFS